MQPLPLYCPFEVDFLLQTYLTSEKGYLRKSFAKGVSVVLMLLFDVKYRVYSDSA
jgi:hypothetical protein